MKTINQKGIAHLVAIIAVGVVLAVGGVGYYVYQNQNKDSKSNTATPIETNELNKAADEAAAKKAAKDHFTLLKEKQIEEAYNSTCQQFQELTALGEFKTQLDQTGLGKVDLSGVEYTDVQVANNQARLTGAIGPLVPNTNLVVDLLKNDGSWCMYGYRTKS